VLSGVASTAASGGESSTNLVFRVGLGFFSVITDCLGEIAVLRLAWLTDGLQLLFLDIPGPGVSRGV